MHYFATSHCLEFMARLYVGWKAVDLGCYFFASVSSCPLSLSLKKRWIPYPICCWQQIVYNCIYWHNHLNKRNYFWDVARCLLNQRGSRTNGKEKGIGKQRWVCALRERRDSWDCAFEGSWGVYSAINRFAGIFQQMFDDDISSRMVVGSSGETTKCFQPQQRLLSMWRMFRTHLPCSSGLPTMDMSMRIHSQ